MNQDEAQFSVEAKLENQVYKWANKYKDSFCLGFRELFNFNLNAMFSVIKQADKFQNF